VADIRTGINARSLAISGDARYVMVANNLPHTLLLLDARDLRPIKIIQLHNDQWFKTWLSITCFSNEEIIKYTNYYIDLMRRSESDWKFKIFENSAQAYLWITEESQPS